MDCSLQGIERIEKITIHSNWIGFASPLAWWDDSEIVRDGIDTSRLARNRMTYPPREKSDEPNEEPWPAMSSASVDQLCWSYARAPLERPDLKTGS